MRFVFLMALSIVVVIIFGLWVGTEIANHLIPPQKQPSGEIRS